ncbi:ArsR family transcriptional regulator [Paraburkholderia sediminicola]|uniref:ArsR family transcriptional regulator n=1 Tax=Paraburkholderia sediminicola TaxID=458836 RepID=UPI0038BCB915
MLPNATVEEFKELNRQFDTRDGYIQQGSMNDTAAARRIADELPKDLTGYPRQVVQFEQRKISVQGMLAQLPESERQFYGGVIAALETAYELETSNDKRYEIDRKFDQVQSAVLHEVSRVGNDPVDRALSIFNPPMGEGYLRKSDREKIDILEQLREDFLAAPDAEERKDIFQEAVQLKSELQVRIALEIGVRKRQTDNKWTEANREVDRILNEAQAQTDPAKRYELIGRQLFQINPGQDELKDKVLLAFTQHMQDSPELRNKLNAWHDQVSGPLNAHGVGAAKRYTDILKNLPQVSADYVRDLSDQYTGVLKDASAKNYSITPKVRAEKLAGQILEGIMRVMFEVSPVGVLADLVPSTLPDNVLTGLEVGGMIVGTLTGLGIGKQVGRAAKAIVAAARKAGIDNLAGTGVRAAGKGLVVAAGEGIVKETLADQALSQQAKAAQQALERQALAEAGPPVDSTSLLAHEAVGINPYGSLANYADPDVLLSNLRPGSKPGILEDARGDKYIELGGQAYHARFDSDSDTWRVFMKGADLKPQYPVRLNAATHAWEVNSDVGLRGGGWAKISDAVRQEVVRLLNEHELSHRAIAAKLGISGSMVDKIAKQENIGVSAPGSLLRLPITPGDRQKVITLLKNGNLSRTEIARQVGIAKSMVTKIAKDNNIVSAPMRQRITPEIRLEVEKLIAEGRLSTLEIASKVGIPGSSVTKIRSGTPLTPGASLPGRKITPAVRQDIIKQLNDGLPYERAAAATGVSVATVGRVARQEGIARRISDDVTPEQIDQIFALRDQGKSIRETVDAVKLSERKVRDIYANYNSDTGKRSWWDTTPANRTAAIQQLDQGKAAKDIARELGLPLETVRGIANQHRIARDSLASELLSQGKSAEEVAQSLGISPAYVRRLAQGVPEGTHDIHLASEDGAVAMDMFQKGYSRQDVANKLGISPWKAHSLANEFRTKIMDSVTPQQLNDIVRALNDEDYFFTTGELAKGAHLPEATVTLIEHEYEVGSIISHPQSPQPGPSSAPGVLRDQYEWVRPLTLDQEVQAMRGMDDGRTLRDVAGELKQDFAAIERLYEEDVPLVAAADDSVAPPLTDAPRPPVTIFSQADEDEIRKLAQDSGLSASFIASLYDASEEKIKNILTRRPGIPAAKV